MKVSEAMIRATEMRPTAMSEPEKARIVEGLDLRIAEMMANTLTPEDRSVSGVWPETDRELLLPEPYCEVYTLYLAAQIDYYNRETDLYANDVAAYSAALSEAQAWWRQRNHPRKSGDWRV